jgi:hypothetical protein
MFVTACAVPQPTSNEDYGVYPKNYREIVNRWTQDNLRYPKDTIDLEITAPEKYVASVARGPSVRRKYGYIVRLRFNAKHASYRGYVRRPAINLLIQDGKVVNSWEEGFGSFPGL